MRARKRARIEEDCPIVKSNLAGGAKVFRPKSIRGTPQGIPIAYSMLRNSASGPVFRAGFLPGCFRAGSSLAKIWPGRPIYGPGALLCNIKFL